MKYADIVVGQEYALGSSSKYESRPQRVRVVKKDVKVYPNVSHLKDLGFLVEKVDGEAEQYGAIWRYAHDPGKRVKGAPFLFRAGAARFLLRTWEEQVKVNGQRAEADRVASLIEQAKKRRMARIIKELEAHGVRGSQPWHGGLLIYDDGLEQLVHVLTRGAVSLPRVPTVEELTPAR